MILDFDPIAIGINLALALAAVELCRALGDPRAGARRDVLAGLFIGIVAGLSLVFRPEIGPAPMIDLAARWGLVLAAGAVFGFLGGGLAAVITFMALVIVSGSGAGQNPAVPAEAATLAALAFGGAAYARFAKRGRPLSLMDMALLAAGAVAVALGLDLALNRPDGPVDTAALGPLAIAVAVNVVVILAVFVRLRVRDEALFAEMNMLRLSRVAVEKGPEAQLWLEPQGRILLANEAVSRLLGYSPEELSRRNIRDLDLNAGDPMSPTKRLLSPDGRWPRSFEGRLTQKASAALALAFRATRERQDDEEVIFVSLRPTEASAPVRETLRSAAPVDLPPEPEPEPETDADETPVDETIDELTALPDLETLRAHGERAFGKLVKKRGFESDTLVYVKIVEYRSYVERRGLSMGEALVQSYARLLRKTLRPGDLAFRTDVDAFAVLMPKRSEESFDYLMGRFNDLARQLNDTGFPDAEFAYGLSAFRGEEEGGFPAVLASATEQVESRMPRRGGGRPNSRGAA